MKSFLILSALSISLYSWSNIEFSPEENTKGKAQPEEVVRSRACFQELKVQGCGDPGEDIKHFLSCLSDVKHSLSAPCKKLMRELYDLK
jgi:hypothetical protein